MKPLKTSSQFLDFPAWLLLFPDVRLGYRSQFPVEIAGFLQYTLSCPAAAFAGFPVQASTWRHSPPFIPARLMSELNTASPSDPSPQLMARLARQTVATLAALTTARKNHWLQLLANALRSESASLVAANQLDLAAAQQAGMAPAMLDRLKLDESRIQSLAGAVDQIRGLVDPVGEVIHGERRPNGLQVKIGRAHV